MNFDWTKPVAIDWSGGRGPLITEHDIKNSVIKRILRNQYCAPFCERQYIRAKPWWNPQYPFGTQTGTTHSYRNNQFIPGLRSLPAYPQPSTMSKLQHHHGLRVLNAKYENVQPRGYPQPNQRDHTVFEEIKELYEAEQKEYLKWAKVLWVNGDCIRALRPKPTIETVYDAEFKMRMYEMQSMPQNYALAAQIPLETKNDSFELEHKGDLISVNVRDLPMLDYPEEMESDFSILLKSCPVPKPCAEHPCKFVLPHEDSVSVLPLSEIHRELAEYAIKNGSTFVASENALRCLLEVDRGWTIPVSVVEVICPEYGDMRSVVVLGSEFVVQKECSKQRTYKAYKHLLQHTFAPSTGHYKSKSPTEQNKNSPQKTINPTVTKEPVTPPFKRIVSLDDDLEVSSDENDDTLLIDDSEPKQSTDRCKPINETDIMIDKHLEIDKYDRVPNNTSKIDECTDEPSSEPDQLFIDNGSEIIESSYGLDFYEPNYSNGTCDAKPSYSLDEPIQEFDRLLAANASKGNPDPLDFYEPNYSNNAHKARPNYSHNHDEPNSEHDRLLVADASEANPKSSDILDFYKPNYSCATKPSYSRDEPSSSPERLLIADSTDEPKMSFYKSNNSNETRAGYSHDEPYISPDRPMINDDETTLNQDSWIQNYSNDTSDSYDSEDDNAARESSTNIVKPSCNKLDTDKLCMKLFETNKDDALSMLEINEDVDAASSMFETNENASEMNVDAATSLFETNGDITESNVDDAQSLFRSNEDTSVSTILVTKVCSNKSMISDVTCDVSSNLTKPSKINEPTLVSDEPMTSDASCEDDSLNIRVSPIKPCKISVRNFSLCETKTCDPTGLFNNLNATDVSPNKNPLKSEVNNSVCGTDSYASEVNVHNTENSKAPHSRLGISGIITRSRRSIGNNNIGVDEPIKKATEATTRLGISGMITRNRRISLTSNADGVNDATIEEIGTKVSTMKPATRRSGRISKANVAEVIGNTESIITKVCGVNEPIKIDVGANPKLATRRSNRINNTSVAEIIEPTSETNKARVVGVNEPIVKDNEVIRKSVRSVRTSNNHVADDIDATTTETTEKDVATSEQPIKNNTENSPKPVRRRSVRINNAFDAEVIEPTEIAKNVTTESLKPEIKRSITETNAKDIEPIISSNMNKENAKFSPVKPCSVSVKPIDIEPFARMRSISGTNTEVSKVTEPVNDKTSEAIQKPNTRKPNISVTNTTVAEVNEPTEKTSEVPINSHEKRITRKRRICSINNEVAKAIEPINENTNKASRKQNTRKLSISDTVAVIEPIAEVINKSLPKPWIKKCSDTSLKNAKKLSVSPPDPKNVSSIEIEAKSKAVVHNINSIETAGSCKTNDSVSNEPSKRKVRKLSEQINLEQDCSQFRSENTRTRPEPRKLSITDIEHDFYISPEPPMSLTVSASNQPSQNSCPIIEMIDDIASIPKNPVARDLNLNASQPKPDVRNLKPTSNAARSISDNMKLNELFGDESDSDEPICNTSPRMNAMDNNTESGLEIIAAILKTEPNDDDSLDSQTIPESITKDITRMRKLSFSDPVSKKPSIEKSPLKPCLRKSISESPRNSKRKLSFSDPLTSDPEFIVSVSETDSEEGIAGFRNGVAVPCSSIAKNPKKKQKNTVTCSYGLRNKPKPTIAKKPESEKKENDVFTKKALPKTQYNTRSVAQRISSSDSDDSDYYKCSNRISTISNTNNKINKQHNTENVALRRSRRISTLVNAEECDDTNKTNAKDCTESTEGVRRSRRLSILTKENMLTKSNISKTIVSPSSSFSKIEKKDNKRRKSLPANFLSDTDKINQVIRSKSMTNVNEIAKTKKTQASRSSTRSKSTSEKKEIKDSLKLSERTKRYLRRVFHCDCSETDQSEDEMLEPTQRNIDRSIYSACSGAEQSKTEINMQTRRYTRSSSMASYARKSNSLQTEARTIDNDKLSERPKRHTRSTALAHSSCDETVLPNQIRRNKTNRQSIHNNIDGSANKMDTSSTMETTPIQLKTEVMDFTEGVESTNNEMDQSTTEPADESLIETYEIKIDVIEETNESNDEIETMRLLHFTELSQMGKCRKNSSHTVMVTNQNSLDTTNNLENINETDVGQSNLFRFTATDVFISDSDEEFYDSQSYTVATSNGFLIDVVKKTIEIDQPQNDHEPIQTKLDFADTHAIDATRSEVIRSRKNSISDASDSSDYFDMNETELNMFHFTATTETDSESEVENLIIDDSQQVAYTNTVVGTNNQTVEQHPAKENLPGKSSNTEQTIRQHSKLNVATVDKTNDTHQSVISTEVEAKIDHYDTRTLTETDNTTKELHRDKSHCSEDLSGQNEALVTNAPTRDTRATVSDAMGVYNCTCKGTLFEVPPPRSFKKWRVRSKNSNLGFDMIVHSSHRARQGAREVVLEPIVEYQPELGGCKQSAGRIRSLALSLMLRETAALFNVRVDYDNGNVIVVDKMSNDDFIARHGDKRSEISETLHTTLNQLRFLKPGQYVLAHDSSHGPNAMLYTTKGVHCSGSAQTFSLHRENINMSDAEDAIFAKAAPELDSVLFPYHKLRSTLPLAFTPFKTQVREDKKIAAALAKAKLPPQAIQWPKKKKNKKSRQNRPAQSSRQQE